MVKQRTPFLVETVRWTLHRKVPLVGYACIIVGYTLLALL